MNLDGFVLVDTHSGEAIDPTGGKFQTESELRRNAEYHEWLKRISNRYDSFVWFNYDRGKAFDMGIIPASVSRMFYMATCLSYDGILTDYFNKPIKRADVSRMIGLSHKSFSDFWNSLKDTGLIVNTEDGIAFGGTWFSRGTNKTEQAHIRVFINAIKELFETNHTAGDHAKLSYVFRLIPFMDFKSNRLTYNGKPMKLVDMCRVLGASENCANTIKSYLLSLKFADNYVCKKIDGYYVINPLLFYASNLIDKNELMNTED